jgi:hypothetical protein
MLAESPHPLSLYSLHKYTHNGRHDDGQSAHKKQRNKNKKRKDVQVAVQRLSMLPNTAMKKAYEIPAAIYGAWCTQFIKNE